MKRYTPVAAPRAHESANTPSKIASRIAAIAGVRRVEFGRQLSVYLAPGSEPVDVIARSVTGEEAGYGLPLIRGSPENAPRPPQPHRAYLAESYANT